METGMKKRKNGIETEIERKKERWCGYLSELSKELTTADINRKRDGKWKEKKKG